jgi:transporter family protein
MKPWLLYSLVTMGLWGFWGFSGKLASRSVASYNLLLLASLGTLMVLPLYFAIFSKHFKFLWQNVDYYFALIGGIVGAIGGLFFYLAISKGETSRVVVITATYPVVTVLLSCLFLRECLTIKKTLGVMFALLGIYLLSR